jgi:hypothetical protein
VDAPRSTARLLAAAGGAAGVAADRASGVAAGRASGTPSAARVRADKTDANSFIAGLLGVGGPVKE